MAIIDDNQFVEVDDRAYVNPQVALDEANQFIDKLRSIQQGNNQQIQTQTYNLGTEVPSNLGGLVGGESYFSSRYQTPQTVSATANLRAAAQAAALNQVLANEQAIWKNRYQQAYRNYQSRQNAKANSYYGGDGTQGGVEYEANDSGEQEVYSVEPSYSPAGSGTFEYTPNGVTTETNSIFDSGTSFNPSTPLFDNKVDIQRDKFGNVVSLTYGGKTFTGDAAQKRYEALQAAGTIGGRK